jgi:cytidylate kinase
MIITIAGLPGAGKTSVAKNLAEKLGMKFYSIGDLRGKIAVEKGMTIDELNALGEESDHVVDDYQTKLGHTEDNIILEGWISWHLVPGSFKILMTVSPEEAARRIFEEKHNAGGSRADERTYIDIADTVQALKTRVLVYKDKFNRLYGITDFTDPSHYDYVLDTSDSPGPDQNAGRIIIALKAKGLLP